MLLDFDGKIEVAIKGEPDYPNDRMYYEARAALDDSFRTGGTLDWIGCYGASVTHDRKGTYALKERCPSFNHGNEFHPQLVEFERLEEIE